MHDLPHLSFLTHFPSTVPLADILRWFRGILFAQAGQQQAQPVQPSLPSLSGKCLDVPKLYGKALGIHAMLMYFLSTLVDSASSPYIHLEPGTYVVNL